jgi:hypothetical protein
MCPKGNVICKIKQTAFSTRQVLAITLFPFINFPPEHYPEARIFQIFKEPVSSHVSLVIMVKLNNRKYAITFCDSKCPLSEINE